MASVLASLAPGEPTKQKLTFNFFYLGYALRLFTPAVPALQYSKHATGINSTTPTKTKQS